MSYVYRLAGENLELAEAELRGFLSSQEIDEDPWRKGRIAVTDSEPSMLRRLALVHEIGKVVERSPEPEFSYSPEGSYAVRSEQASLEEEVGEQLSDSGNEVDLENPDSLFKIYEFGDEFILAEVVEEIDRGLFRQRSNEKREFSSPVSLDPVLARVMVNLSGVSAGSSLLDPFCGTGGILIEAGLCGIEVYGCDIQQEMVEGTVENLESYGIINHDIRNCGVEEALEEFSLEFDTVVADLPYGQSSKVEGEPVEEFLRLVENVPRAVFMYDEPELGDFKADFEIYVHKNLTRYIYSSS